MSNAIRDSRRVKIDVSIGGHDATGHISPSLLTFTYTDNISGKADEVQISLQDRDGNWSGPWEPSKGMDVVARLECQNWFADGESLTLNCGSFRIDEVDLKGPPDIYSIKAVTSDLTSALRDTTKTRGWENTNLQEIANQVAGEHGLALHYDGPSHSMKRQDQREEADLPFVHRIAKERGMECKIYDKKLILFDSQQQESKSSSITLTRKDSVVLQYSFSGKSSQTSYSKAEVKYTDTATGTTHTATAAASPAAASTSERSGSTSREFLAIFDEEESSEGGEKTLQLNERVESSAEAIRLADKRLHDANKKENKASLSCMGHPGLVAGITVQLADFGNFSGAYIIEKATHTLSGQGYTTNIELRKCNTAPATTSTEGSKPVAKK